MSSENVKLEPSAEAAQLSAARQAADRTRASSAAVRYRFIARPAPDPEADAPPLARLLRGGGGKGGEARLKLYLSMLWLARNESHPVMQYSAQEWALLLGYGAKPAGVRRVQESLRWLDDEAFVELRHRPGAASAIHLLSDSGDGRAYEPPGIVYKRLTGKRAKPQERALRNDHLYVQLPATLWTNGWIMKLSGAAIAMYLVLLHEQRGEKKQVWISPRIGRELYDISDETRRKGLRELAKQALIRVSRRALHQGLFAESVRTRYVYDLDPSTLGHLQAHSPFNHPDPYAALE
ncbi:hypothetical protein [Streptomyces sp. bgisy060]|uniref:hypothetical protein n=1 Tax=Streptomyces sp. bgisy060 TaxID=3413775 RepID=UPI003EBB179B